MTKIIIISFILFVNVIGAFFFAFVNKDKQEKWICLFFLILPVFGFFLYFFMSLAIKVTHNNTSYDRDNLVANLELPDEVKSPNINEDLSVVSIRDALSVSTTNEKRELILNQLKKDDESVYKSLLVASRDSDSEIAHYVATAKVSAYDKAYANFRKAKTEYEIDSTIDNLLTVLESTNTLIQSGVLSSAEQDLYCVEYCNLIEQNIDQENLPIEYFDDYTDYLIRLNKIDDLLRFWEFYQPNCNSEFIYFEMLSVFHKNNDKSNFFITLEQIKNSEILLSSKGLTKLRFWMKRGET